MIFGNKRIKALEEQLENLTLTLDAQNTRIDNLSAELSIRFSNLQSQILDIYNTDVKAMTEKLAAKRLRQRAYAREYYKKNKAVVNAKTAARRKAKAGK